MFQSSDTIDRTNVRHIERVLLPNQKVNILKAYDQLKFGKMQQSHHSTTKIITGTVLQPSN